MFDNYIVAKKVSNKPYLKAYYRVKTIFFVYANKKAPVSRGVINTNMLYMSHSKKQIY